MDFFLIRHKQTKDFIPQIRQRNKTSASLTSKGVPRLFTSRRAATSSLGWWVKGISYARYHVNDGDSLIETTKDFRRNAEDMEIVEVCLEEIHSCQS